MSGAPENNIPFSVAWDMCSGRSDVSRAVQLARGGMLYIEVSSQDVLMELGFQKTKILKKIQNLYPNLKVTDIRFAVSGGPYQAERKPDSPEIRKPYSEKLRDPRWQKMRLEIMQRDGWACQSCLSTDRTLNVHHRWYENGKEPWEYELKALVTLCEQCHELESKGRQLAEQLLLGACSKRLLHSQLLVLALTVEGLDPSDAKRFCEAIYFTPESKIIELHKQHHDKLAAGPAPYIELSPQERDCCERRRAVLQRIAEKIQRDSISTDFAP